MMLKREMAQPFREPLNQLPAVTPKVPVERYG